LGLAAGTIPKQYVRVFPQLQAVGIELDPAIIAAGESGISISADPRIATVAGDGRYELNQLAGPV
jgi:spermidine synthase